MKSIRTKVIELLQLGHWNPVLVDRMGTATTVENKIDALHEFSAQNAIARERADLAAGCKALIDDSMPALSDEEIHGLTGGLIGLDTAKEMACMVYEQEALSKKIENMRSRGYSEEYIGEFISVCKNPGRKMVVSPRTVE